jgi:Ca2+-binding EF-hand superfamily protein
MGNKIITHNNLKGNARLAANKFDDDEIIVLEKTWQDLADRTNGKGIDKDTFLQYFPLNGLLGDRLFTQFDIKNIGLIDFEGFILGLATLCRGNLDDKIHFIFNLFDVGEDHAITKKELSLLINHIPKESTGKLTPLTNPSSTNNSDSDSESSVSTVDSNSKSIEGTHNNLMNRGRTTSSCVVDSYTNHDIVEQAFEECDLNHEGRLSYEEFKMYVYISISSNYQSNFSHANISLSINAGGFKETLWCWTT